MKTLTQILLAIGIVTLSSVASATTIDGVIKLGGDLTFDFSSNSVDILGDDAVVISPPTGSFATYVSSGDNAVYNDFVYDPFVTVSPLWTVGGFSFALSSISDIQEITSGAFKFLVLAGSGTVTGNGFDATHGEWTFSADNVGGEFAFSSTNVPEPTVALLLGVGLIGFGVSRKLRKTA